MSSLMRWKQMHPDRPLRIGAKVKYRVCFSLRGFNLLCNLFRSVSSNKKLTVINGIAVITKA